MNTENSWRTPECKPKEISEGEIPSVGHEKDTEIVENRAYSIGSGQRHRQNKAYDGNANKHQSCKAFLTSSASLHPSSLQRVSGIELSGVTNPDYYDVRPDTTLRRMNSPMDESQKEILEESQKDIRKNRKKYFMNSCMKNRRNSIPEKKTSCWNSRRNSGWNLRRSPRRSSWRNARKILEGIHGGKQFCSSSGHLHYRRPWDIRKNSLQIDSIWAFKCRFKWQQSHSTPSAEEGKIR